MRKRSLREAYSDLTESVQNRGGATHGASRRLGLGSKWRSWSTTELTPLRATGGMPKLCRHVYF